MDISTPVLYNDSGQRCKRILGRVPNFRGGRIVGELIDRPNGDIAFPEDGDKVLSLSDSSPHFNFNAFLGDLSQCVYIGDVLAGIKAGTRYVVEVPNATLQAGLDAGKYFVNQNAKTGVTWPTLVEILPNGKKKFVAKAENLTVGQLLDVWAEEELKTGTLSNGTVENYLGTIRNIKKHPLAERKLKNVTSEHLQSFFDLLSFGGVHPDGKERKGYSKDYIHSFSAVMQQSFRFAVFPKQYITFNPMQYIKLRYQTDEVDLFSDEDMDGNVQPISREDYERLLAYLQKKNPAAILPIQIAYYAGLRIGEACGLAWQDVNLEEQCLTIRRSIRYDGSKRKYIIGPTKRKKVRVVDFGDTLVEIFRNARKEQLKNRMQYGELYHTNYYKEVKEKNRVYYEYYCLDRTEEVPADYKEISFVCLRPDGCLELPTTLGTVCRKVAKTLEGFEGFHFHQLRHTYTSNLLANGAAPKDVQELLGHSDVSTTMNVYAHSTRDAKRKSVRLLDKVVGND